mmetsp:Transcript_28624/g.58621  ORF Transcript_28624/g.58621 Transcript_28624/m.58621 type:complete len:477 (-) Transcript_28624:416-1846(-)
MGIEFQKGVQGPNRRSVSFFQSKRPEVIRHDLLGQSERRVFGSHVAQGSQIKRHSVGIVLFPKEILRQVLQRGHARKRIPLRQERPVFLPRRGPASISGKDPLHGRILRRPALAPIRHLEPPLLPPRQIPHVLRHERRRPRSDLQRLLQIPHPVPPPRIVLPPGGQRLQPLQPPHLPFGIRRDVRQQRLGLAVRRTGPSFRRGEFLGVVQRLLRHVDAGFERVARAVFGGEAAAEEGEAEEVEDPGAEGRASFGVEEEEEGVGAAIGGTETVGIDAGVEMGIGGAAGEGREQGALASRDALALQGLPGVGLGGLVGAQAVEGLGAMGVEAGEGAFDSLFRASLGGVAVFVGLVGGEGGAEEEDGSSEGGGSIGRMARTGVSARRTLPGPSPVRWPVRRPVRRPVQQIQPLRQERRRSGSPRGSNGFGSGRRAEGAVASLREGGLRGVHGSDGGGGGGGDGVRMGIVGDARFGGREG